MITVSSLSASVGFVLQVAFAFVYTYLWINQLIHFSVCGCTGSAGANRTELCLAKHSTVALALEVIALPSQSPLESFRHDFGVNPR